MINRRLLEDGLKMFGISVDDETFSVLDGFSDFVIQENKRFNLTSLTDADSFTEKHLIDSLSSLSFIPQGATLCDVGAGAGFPSFPIAAVRRDVSVTALDSTAKKTDFIERAAKKFSVSNLSCLTKRAEECTHERETFDVVTARAVAPIGILAELAIPLVRPGGIFIAYKTDASDIPSEKTLSVLGAALKESFSYPLPSGDKRVLSVFLKTGSTSPDLPRRYGVIKKSPLK